MSVERKSELDAFKGVLIALIVLGHNYYFSRYAVSWFILIYGFHVSSFLLFPFMFRYDDIDRKAYAVRMFRVLVPQAAFLLVVIPVYFFMFVVDGQEGTVDWFTRLPMALLLQSETQLEAVTGFRHFWFLPAMATLISLLWFLDNARLLAAAVLVVALTIWHFAAGEVYSSTFQYFPWGTALVGFLFVPGLIVRKVQSWMERRRPQLPVEGDILLLALWMSLGWVAVRFGLFMPLAGDPYGLISGYTQTGRLLFQDLFLLVSFFAVLRLGWWLRGTILTSIGRESLKIFLLSPLVWQMFWMSGGQYLVAATTVGRMVLVVSTFVGTMVVSYALARLIAATPLQAALFPRHPADWRKLWRRDA